MNKGSFIKNKYYLNVILLVINALVIVFIFSRSLTPDYISQEESEDITGFLNFLLPFELSDHIVRKIAHFIEFAGLGVFTSFSVFSFYRKPLKGTFIKLFVCLSVAVTDEALQLNVQGRSGQITDVILDFSGSFFGVLMMTLLVFLVLCIKQKNKGRE
ncbi:MAG: VanZ family protein [Oscillospiraceae bacterium]|nr:VanZ family protein [Oscillospiraceae bacterium]